MANDRKPFRHSVGSSRSSKANFLIDLIRLRMILAHCSTIRIPRFPGKFYGVIVAAESMVYPSEFDADPSVACVLFTPLQNSAEAFHRFLKFPTHLQ